MTDDFIKELQETIAQAKVLDQQTLTLPLHEINYLLQKIEAKKSHQSNEPNN